MIRAVGKFVLFWFFNTYNQWMDYVIASQELEEADELCHGNWIEIEKKNEYI